MDPVGNSRTEAPALTSLALWPGRERREPQRSNKDYLVLRALVQVLSREIDRALGERAGLSALDVGCGSKPYYPLFARRAIEYRGLDAAPGPQVDDIGSIDALPYPDAAFDVVLCTQVLEHVDDPAGAVREIFRVLKPNGVAFVSTHGVFVYHPDPVDLWRWTIEGLGRLFRTSVEGWSDIRVSPNGEASACLGYLACQYVDLLGRWLPGDAVRRGMVATVNTVAEWLDPRFPANARVTSPGSLSANFLVTATKAYPVQPA